jgi:hypothetical protein
MASNAARGISGYARHQTPSEEMAAFDDLPPSLRAVMRDAKLDWPAVDVRRRLVRGEKAADLAQRIVSYEAASLH